MKTFITNEINKMRSITNNTSNGDESILNDLKEVFFKNNFSLRDNSSRRDYK